MFKSFGLVGIDFRGTYGYVYYKEHKQAAKALQETDMKISYNGRYVQVMPLTPKIEPNATNIAPDNKFKATKTKLSGKRPRGRPVTRQVTIDQ